MEPEQNNQKLYAVSYIAAEAQEYGFACAVLLSNIRIFSDYHKEKNNEPYYHSQDQIAKTVGLPRKAILSAAKKLKELGLIDYKIGYVPGTHEKTTFWTVFSRKSQMGQSESPDLDNEKVPNYTFLNRNNIKELNTKDINTPPTINKVNLKEDVSESESTSSSSGSKDNKLPTDYSMDNPDHSKIFVEYLSKQAFPSQCDKHQHEKNTVPCGGCGDVRKFYQDNRDNIYYFKSLVNQVNYKLQALPHDDLEYIKQTANKNGEEKASFYLSKIYSQNKNRMTLSDLIENFRDQRQLQARNQKGK